MKKLGKIGVRIFWGLSGLSALYLNYSMIAEKIALQKYQALFAQVQHLPNTSTADSLALNITYYPATYVDDSIHIKNAYLAGEEIRSYTDSWRDIVNFYGDQILEKHMSTPIRILVLPIKFEKDGKQISMDTERGFASGYGYAFDPFTADILSGIEEHYASKKLPKGLTAPQGNLYLVCSVWP